MKHVLAGVFAGVFAVALIACGSGKKTDEAAFQASLDSTNAAEPQVDEEFIEAILQQIPSPIEISVLLKESGRKYDHTMLNSPDNLAKYNNNYKMALNLGVYGTDLGYTNIYEQNQDGIKYLQPIETLAEGLNIGQFFEIEDDRPPRCQQQKSRLSFADYNKEFQRHQPLFEHTEAR
ncbi:MAG: hypothetical protein WDO15_23425 [Bacteroidota bacterium]